MIFNWFSKSCPQMSLTHLPSESVMLLLFWVYFRRCIGGHCFMIMRQNMRSMVIWRRGEISQTVTVLPTVVKPQSSTGFFIGRQRGRRGLWWPQMLVPPWCCGGWTVGFSQSIFSHGSQKIEIWDSRRIFIQIGLRNERCRRCFPNEFCIFGSYAVSQSSTV